MLARFFIDRPVLAWVISIVIVLLGAIAAGFLPIAQYPEITPPTIRVTANYPGANAQVVADTVAAPIEQQVNGVEKHAVHVVAEQQRRLLHSGRDVRARHRPQHGPGAGAEPRRHRRADAARRGQGHRRDHQEAVAGHLAGRSACIPRTTRRPASRITMRST